MQVFRQNIFSMSDRKQIPTLIYQILEAEMESESAEAAAVEEEKKSDFKDMLKNKYDQNLFKIAQEVYHSLQIVLEFMDKGMKGLLTGDLSVYIVQQIQTSIEKYQISFDDASKQIEEILEKQQNLDAFYSENFSVGSVLDENARNSPQYENYQNFESYLLLMEKSDWKKNVQLKDSNNYASVNMSQFINPEMLS